MDDQLTFPVIGFLRSGDTAEGLPNERFRLYADEAAWGQATQGELKHDLPGMLLVDDRGRAWHVKTASSREVLTPLWRRVLFTLAGARSEIVHGIDHELEPLGSMPFPEVQDRICRSVRQNPYDWLDDEALAGEAGPPLNLEDALDGWERVVRQAHDLRDLLAGLEAAWAASETRSASTMG